MKTDIKIKLLKIINEHTELKRNGILVLYNKPEFIDKLINLIEKDKEK